MIPVPQLTARDKLALRVGTAVVLPALLLGFVLVPLRDRVKLLSAELEAERALLTRERALAAQLGDLRRASTAVDLALAKQASRLFVVAAGVEAGREGEAFLDFVRIAAAASNVSLLQSDIEEGEAPVGALTSAGLNIVAESDLRGLLAFLERLEDGPKLIRVGDAQILALSSTSDHEFPEVLQLRAHLLGYLPSDPQQRPGR